MDIYISGTVEKIVFHCWCKEGCYFFMLFFKEDIIESRWKEAGVSKYAFYHRLQKKRNVI